MDDGDEPSKKRIRCGPEGPYKEVKETLLGCLRHYDTGIPTLTSLKIKYCNGATSTSFSDAYCETERSPYVFSISSIFKPGIIFLKDVLNEVETDMTFDKQSAVDRLLCFFRNIDGVSRQLCKEHGDANSEKNRESHWVVQLVHHLLKPLAVEQYYTMDSYSKFRLNKCSCCEEDISGEYDDTSIGHEHVWHGCADVLMEQRSVALKLIGDFEKEDEMEDEDETNLTNLEAQIISQTIVFAFLQKKIRSTSAQNDLIPTIGISKKKIMLYFYDPEFDILLQSSFPLPIWSESGKLSPHTMLALWLAINYTVTCSGITDRIFESGFKANFLTHFDDDIQYKYKKQLRFGSCINKQQNEDDSHEILALFTDGKPMKGEYIELCKQK